jgi:hypothetical protein
MAQDDYLNQAILGGSVWNPNRPKDPFSTDPNDIVKDPSYGTPQIQKVEDREWQSHVDPFTGFTPKHAMDGFDFARLQDPNKSAKDAFAWLAQQAPPPPTDNKDALGVWFNTYIKPGMQKLGHNVTDVQGDKFRFNNWQGDFWVDYGRGAGAPGGALAWQADYASGGPSNQAYKQTQQAILTPQQTQTKTAGVPQTYGQGTDLSNYYDYLGQLLKPEER